MPREGFQQQFFMWANQSKLRIQSYSFKVQELHANGADKAQAEKFIGSEIASSYRNPAHLKRMFESKTSDDLFAYLEKNVFPVDRNGEPHDASQRMVKAGDFGEVVAACLAKVNGDLEIPLTKLLWKMNKDKSMFCTDLFCHDVGLLDKKLQYWEVKTKSTLDKKKVSKRNSNFYVPVHAHDALLHDIESSNDQVADFLCRQKLLIADRLEEAGNQEEASKTRDIASKYQDIATDSSGYDRSYVICLILDNPNAFDEKLLAELHDLPSGIAHLTVKLILIPELKSIITNSYIQSYLFLKDYVFGAPGE